MDVKIFGAGTVGKGKYETVSINGSANISGDIECSDFTVSGACSSSGRIDCENEIKVRGSAAFRKDVSADTVHCMGTAVFSGNVSCNNIKIEGTARFCGDTKCDSFVSSGIIECDGVLNAKNTEIVFGGKPKVKEICGSIINIECIDDEKSFLKKLVSSKKDGKMTVSESIGGDEVSVSGVIAPLVSGRNVVIGKDCIIDRVVYTESIEISPKAKVKESEKR